ncbi:hypothetical protein HNP10_000714 [Aeromonas veronii]|nr:hypothetical protein [Aeromonas veronii]
MPTKTRPLARFGYLAFALLALLLITDAIHPIVNECPLYF